MDEQAKLREIKKQLEQVAKELGKLSEIVRRLRDELNGQKESLSDDSS